MIDPNLKHAVGANLTVDDADIVTDEDYRIAARNAVFVLRARKADLPSVRMQLEALLAGWDKSALKEFASGTDRDWFATEKTETQLRIVIEEMIKGLSV